MATKPKSNQVDWELAAGFSATWKKFKCDALDDAMKVFNERKRSIPPLPLPKGMKDHKLNGRLSNYWECHLAGNALLIYKPLPGGAIKLFRVCTHDEIKGPRGKALAEALKKE
jgi:addiction module RelE/StbE family toxin